MLRLSWGHRRTRPQKPTTAGAEPYGARRAGIGPEPPSARANGLRPIGSLLEWSDDAPRPDTRIGGLRRRRGALHQPGDAGRATYRCRDGASPATARLRVI